MRWAVGGCLKFAGHRHPLPRASLLVAHPMRTGVCFSPGGQQRHGANAPRHAGMAARRAVFQLDEARAEAARSLSPSGRCSRSNPPTHPYLYERGDAGDRGCFNLEDFQVWNRTLEHLRKSRGWAAKDVPMFQTLPATDRRGGDLRGTRTRAAPHFPAPTDSEKFSGTDDRVDPVTPASPKTVPGSGSVLLAGKGAPFEAPVAKPR